MLDYGWVNPLISGDEQQTQETDPTRPIYDQQTHPQTFNDHFLPQQTFPNQNASIYNQTSHHFHPIYNDPRAYQTSASAYTPTPAALFSLENSFQGGGGSNGYFLMPKSEEVSRPLDFTSSRIGLNLGGRTYFSAADHDDFVSRLYRRSRPGESGGGGAVNTPRCQAEGCNADLTHAKHYHRRHKVCEFHSKASTVIAAGLTQRFCQQCSRFHLLSEFDNGKRSCRKRLADHNRRRRKSHQQETQKTTPPENPRDSSPRSPQDSGARSSSSVTVPMSPPRITLDCFGQRSYQAAATSSSSASSSSSIFFSCG